MTKTTDYLKSKNISYTATTDGKIIVNESISIDGEVTLDDVIEVGGSVDVRQGATLTAPALAKCGSVYVQQGATLTAPALAKCGSVYVRQGATLTAPALAEVGVYVDVWDGATLTAPALAKCGSVYVQQGATLTAPALAKCGSVYVRQGATLTAPALAEVGVYVDVWDGATLTAPALAKCGSVYVQQGATLTAPALAKCGSVYVRQGATLTAPALAEVGVYVDVWDGATLTAPALAEVGGSVYVRQGASFEAPELDTVDHVACEIEFLGHKIKVFDGIGCVVSSEKTRDGVTIRSCRKSRFKNGKLTGDKFYVASKDGRNSHAETIAESIQELAFKTGNRDIEQYRNMPKNTKKSPKEWAFIYRMVTGACQYGTNSFMKEQGKMKKAYTLTEILSLTEGRYGHDTFKKVVGA